MYFLSIKELTFNNGDLLVILSSILWALYTVLIKLKPKELSDIEYFSTIVILGLFMLSFAYFIQFDSLQSQINLIKNNYLVFLYTSILASSVSYYFWHEGISSIGANKTGQFTHLMPVFGIFLAYLFLDETLESYHLVGVFFIMLGIYLSIFYKMNAKN